MLNFSEGGEVAPETNILEDPDPFSSSTFPDDESAPVHSTPAPPSLTEEQQQRIELNRQRALERKLARQQQQQQEEGWFGSLLLEFPCIPVESSTH